MQEQNRMLIVVADGVSPENVLKDWANELRSRIAALGWRVYFLGDQEKATTFRIDKCVNERRWWHFFRQPKGSALRVLAYFGEERNGALMADEISELADRHELLQWARIFVFSYVAGLTDRADRGEPAYQVIQHEGALSLGTIGFEQMSLPHFENQVFAHWKEQYSADVRAAFGKAVTYPAMGLTARSPNSHAILRETRRLYMRVVKLVEDDPVGKLWIGSVALSNMDSLRSEGFVTPH